MLVVVLGAFLPWVSIFGISVIGVEGDGVITLVLAVIGLVLLALTSGLVGQPKVPGKASQITLLVLAILVALVGIIDMNGAAAIGLYLTMFAGLAWVVGAVWQLSLPSAQGDLPVAQSDAATEGPFV